jgi:hypothetical protein
MLYASLLRKYLKRAQASTPPLSDNLRTPLIDRADKMTAACTELVCVENTRGGSQGVHGCPAETL